MYLPIYGETQIINSHYPYIYEKFDRIREISSCIYSMGPQYGEDNSYATRENHSNAHDGGLYYTFFKHTTQMFGEYPLLDWGLRASLPEATSNEYYIKFIVAPIAWMEQNQQPVVVEGAYGHAHYCGAIGYSYDWCWIFKTYLRIFVTDNGFMIENQHGYPFWSLLGGLNYAWVLNKK